MARLGYRRCPRPGTSPESTGSHVSFTHIAIVMPAYNEADGIAGFLEEIHEHLESRCDRLDIIVADDRSTDATASVVAHLELPGVEVQTQPANRGHGPTALAAYRAGLATSADLIVHVDGDGQFTGEDIARVVGAVESEGADVVHGVRRGRDDPWYRRMLSAGLRLIVRPFAGRAVPDINTPLRAYRPEVIATLLDAGGADALGPHEHFSLAEARGRVSVRYVAVRSLPRRGAETTGTMWGTSGQPMLPPPRLRAFARDALIELWRLSLRPAAPMRGVREQARQEA
jgi:glycosyltransferase involved in cell wall biosynthesis